ncbi:MAG: SPOR domain-containing protein [Deferribacteres bacterium]|nr:SPOR domain-containing protein [candidate division KSB1 bacterium]MCB9500562.1 SPOR domain-containing protein [Deferribacteres bacterium]
MASQKIIRLLLLFLPILFITCGKNDEKPEEQLPPNNTLEIQQAIKSDTIKPAEMPLAQEVNQHDPVKAIPNPDDLAAWFDKSGIYTLQLSSWKTRSHAERDRKRFYDAGLDCRIEETVPPGSDRRWYRIRLGSFRTRKAAREFAERYVQDLLEEPAWVDYK